MALDPRYIVAPALQQHFTDKDTGEFLRNGYVLFFRDVSRTDGKTIYRLSGSPPNYTYVPYGTLDGDGAWRIDLNDQGAFDYTVFYFPFDDSGEVDLYFIQVYNSDDVLQFSVEAYPNYTASSSTTQVQSNYVRSGQFRLHTNLPADSTHKVGEIRAAVTNIAWGGWTFERPGGSTALDIVTFQRFGSAVTNPDGNPRYGVRVKTESPSGGDSYKDLRLKFLDVNKFASDSNQFTFAFSGETNTGSGLQVDLILIKNYGTGGDTTTETFIETFTIMSSYDIFAATFEFGTNEGKIIGADDDDFLQFALRFPVDSVFDATFTDFILTSGSVLQPGFPDTPDEQFAWQGIAGGAPIPNPDGSNLYLPLLLSPTGIAYDESIVGKIFPAVYETAKLGELLCDGSQYETAALSPDGIPYSRLQAVLYNSTTNLPKFGTGRDFLTTDLTEITPANQLRISTNTAGSVTNTADGSVATTFTFANIHTGAAANVKGLYAGGRSLYIWNNVIGAVTAAAAGTSGFTITTLRNNASVRAIFLIKTILAAALAGAYFTFSAGGTNYYVWFKVDGAGADPAPGGTGIEVDLLSTWPQEEVAKCVAEAISGFQLSTIVTKAGSVTPDGSYFNIYTLTEPYYVWYTVDGAGTDPAPPGKIGIKVAILSTDTDVQVAQKTQSILNSKYFAVPDARGVFLRGWDNGSGIDPDAATRWSFYSMLNGDEVGTFQFDELISHTHTVGDVYIQNVQAGVGANSLLTLQVVGAPINNITGDLTGGAEDRPINMSVNYVIKY